MASSPVPVQVTGLTSGVTSVSVGGGFACAVTSGGAVMCWGENNVGQLGNNSDAATNSYVPVQVSGLTSGVTSVSANDEGYARALTSGGDLMCWGNNGDGNLDNGSLNNSTVPGQALHLTSGVTSVSTGSGSSCAVLACGAVCWGYNGFGQLGNDSSNSSNVPVPVSVISGSPCP